MKAESWILDAVGESRVRQISIEAERRRIRRALALDDSAHKLEDQEVRFVAQALELELFDLLERDDSSNELSVLAAEIFQIARTLALPTEAVSAGERLLWLGCLATLGDRSADFRRIVADDLPLLPFDSPDWGTRVWASVLDVWLRLLRKQGWEDLDKVQHRIVALRKQQREIEPDFLQRAEGRRDVRPAWELMAHYHLAKAAEILALYLGQGSVDGSYDIRAQLDAQFDRAIGASVRGGLIDREVMGRLLARAARAMVNSSIWTVTRAVNSKVSRFVKSLTRRGRPQPIFEMLPPQRRALREEGLLGSSHRAVVVSLPTSSGKTLIAQFRILQALNQFEEERGWVAYIAPTRALVNQLTTRLRRDFAEVGVVVEKVSPALEIDGLEAAMLSESDRDIQFRVLVTTPEKLDLMLRGGWEAKIDRPLTLVVVDEAHNLNSSEGRGLKLELLLATINRWCAHAQFLLLTPFIPNAREIAKWLSSDSNKGIELGVDWTPNDRVVAVVRAEQGSQKGDFRLRLKTLHTTRNTLQIPDSLGLGESRPLGLSWSKVARSGNKLAAASAHCLQKRGTVIVLAASPRDTWRIANDLKADENRRPLSDDLEHIQQFLRHEMGETFPIAELLEYGIGIHHRGISEETRALIEWLAETEQLGVLVATTTIAQGVNFPVSGVIFANHRLPLGKSHGWRDIPPQEFWNIAGRAGRVDQGDIGMILLTAKSAEDENKLDEFVDRSVGALNSTLIEMVQQVVEAGWELDLARLPYYHPEWSAFVQYLAHTYRRMGSYEEFAAEVEQVLRGTLGFEALRKSHSDWAEQLIGAVYKYAENLKGKPLHYVDLTGFSMESVVHTFHRIGNAGLSSDVWSPELFTKRREELRRMMGLLLEIPELRRSLVDVTGGQSPDGNKLARIVSDWVGGRSLADMANTHFAKKETDVVESMTKCCEIIFGRLTQTVSWGLAALQTLMWTNLKLEELPAEEQKRIRNLPAWVYYGVNSNEAVALRMLGVPRAAAPALARRLGINSDAPLYKIRKRLRESSLRDWESALGDRGASYHRVWTIIEGEA